MTPFLSALARGAGTPATPGAPTTVDPALARLCGSGALAKDSSAASGESPRSAHGVRVHCVREGDRVVRLIVTCACGERHEIDCHYAPD
jgi:hypothetical protein